MVQTRANTMKENPPTIKITKCHGSGLALGDHELSLGFGYLTQKVSSLTSEMEASGEVIDDLFSAHMDDMNDRKDMSIYHHQEEGEPDEPYNSDKIEIKVESEYEFDAVSKALRLAADYIDENQDKYESLGDIKVASAYKSNCDVAKITLYMFKKSDDEG